MTTEPDIINDDTIVNDKYWCLLSNTETSKQLDQLLELIDKSTSDNTTSANDDKLQEDDDLDESFLTLFESILDTKLSHDMHMLNEYGPAPRVPKTRAPAGGVPRGRPPAGVRGGARPGAGTSKPRPVRPAARPPAGGGKPRPKATTPKPKAAPRATGSVAETPKTSLWNKTVTLGKGVKNTAKGALWTGGMYGVYSVAQTGRDIKNSVMEMVYGKDPTQLIPEYQKNNPEFFNPDGTPNLDRLGDMPRELQLALIKNKSISIDQLPLADRIAMKALASHKLGGWKIEHMVATAIACYGIWKLKDWIIPQVKSWWKHSFQGKTLAKSTFDSEKNSYLAYFDMKHQKWFLKYTNSKFLSKKADPSPSDNNSYFSSQHFKTFAQKIHKDMSKYLNDENFKAITDALNMVDSQILDSSTKSFIKEIVANRNTILANVKNGTH